MARLTGTSQRLLSRPLHRPSAGLLVRLDLHRRLISSRPCATPRQLAARRRLHRRMVEAMATTLATTVLTSLALAHPAVLRDAPTTTWARLMAPVAAGEAGQPLIDCP
ncbi:MAG: hypothetical protein ACKOPS_12825 [Cyanobium sp.]